MALIDIGEQWRQALLGMAQGLQNIVSELDFCINYIFTAEGYSQIWQHGMVAVCPSSALTASLKKTWEVHYDCVQAIDHIGGWFYRHFPSGTLLKLEAGKRGSLGRLHEMLLYQTQRQVMSKAVDIDSARLFGTRELPRGQPNSPCLHIAVVWFDLLWFGLLHSWILEMRSLLLDSRGEIESMRGELESILDISSKV
jgi:hypothetical protein